MFGWIKDEQIRALLWNYEVFEVGNGRATKKNFDASKSDDDTPNTTSRPIHLNTVCFGSTLKAIENSSETNKSLKALDILSEMRVSVVWFVCLRKIDIPNSMDHKSVKS